MNGSVTAVRTARCEVSADGTLVSPEFKDVYHSADGGLAQSRHVFLAGNELPARWKARPSFVILETGFGLGLNFLAAWDAWRRDAGRSRRRHFVLRLRRPLLVCGFAPAPPPLPQRPPPPHVALSEVGANPGGEVRSSRRAIVVGGGLAGTLAAERLASRDWDVDLIDARPARSTAAVGLLRPIANLRDAVNAQVSRSAFLYALQHYRALQYDGYHLQWNRCGVLQLAAHATAASRLPAIAASQGYP